jgi:hypothetical protein
MNALAPGLAEEIIADGTDRPVVRHDNDIPGGGFQGMQTIAREHSAWENRFSIGSSNGKR